MNTSAITKKPLATKILSAAFNARGVNNPKRLHHAVNGKTILITGASFGLGEATAIQLAAAGATVLMVARSTDKLEQVAAGIRSTGGRVFSYTADLSDIPQVEALIDTILAEHGSVDVLVNNAGKSIRRSVTLCYDRFKDYDRTNAINYLGPVRLTLGLLPSMQANGGGHIVNVSTVGVRVAPTARWAAYQASKAAFDVWLRSVAIEVAPLNITTSTIYMGLIHTRMSAPTPSFKNLPGLSPVEAAHLIERAIVDKTREISPPWLSPVELVSAVFRTPIELLSRSLYRNSRDTSSATATLKNVAGVE